MYINLTFSTQGKSFSRHFVTFSLKTGFDISCTLSPYETICVICEFLLLAKIRQEAHGSPELNSLCKQMLCNIFPILSLQLMKGSSFEQFLVLKKKNVLPYMGMTVNLNTLSIRFQQWDRHELWWKLAKWFLKGRHVFIYVYSTGIG